MTSLHNEKSPNPKSQQERVIAVCSDGKYRTLDDIQHEIKKRSQPTKRGNIYADCLHEARLQAKAYKKSH